MKFVKSGIHTFEDRGQRTIEYWSNCYNSWQKTNIPKQTAIAALSVGLRLRSKYDKPLTTREDIEEYYIEQGC